MASLLGYSSVKLLAFFKPWYNLDFARHYTENNTEMKPAVRGLRGLKVRIRCLKGVIEAPLKFEQ